MSEPLKIEVPECTWCHKPIVNQEYARMKIAGQYLYFHDNRRAITSCYGDYLLKHLEDTKGIQAT